MSGRVPGGVGRVALVGAGPGDPGLLTVRGRELLEGADAVVLDRLGTEALVGLCRPGARLVDAGKAPGRAALTQDQINATLVDLAREGLDVVRLKGGDPFVFGRGGEEVIALREAGIPVEVVPGITSAIGAPAYAGIPVTHRAVATAFTVVTGHEDPGKGGEQTDWAALARTPGTLVVLMGMGRLAGITQALVAAGRSAGQPAAAVQWGTTDRQREVVATLGTLAEAVAAAGLGSPAVVVVGDVAGLRGRVAWRGIGPLAGRRVVVTRARAQAGELAGRLRALGAEVVELPTIRIVPCHGPAVDAMCDAIGRYRLIVLTSVNGVDQLFARLAERGRDARSLAADACVVAIGPATAERLAAHGVRADVVPARFVGEAVLEALAARPVAGVPTLVARAREARELIVQGLRERGAEVDEVALYETVLEDPSPAERDRARAADYVTFTASSTVRNWHRAIGAEGAPAARIVSIGPVTSGTLRELGMPVHAEAGEHTIPGLVRALVRDAAPG
ncbi:MAG TPA: uroporphyrinogen-III C-methyltransferase [Miltoncostaeaceae bacterium]|nr:uroporphyrinogen-III C-methyltransferase [Miltoncostaeaceae bacterium]